MYNENSKEFGEKMEKESETPLERMEQFTKKYAAYNFYNNDNNNF